MPVSKSLPYHGMTRRTSPCTVADFDAFCTLRALRVLERVVLHQTRRVTGLPTLRIAAIYRFQRG